MPRLTPTLAPLPLLLLACGSPPAATEPDTLAPPPATDPHALPAPFPTDAEDIVLLVETRLGGPTAWDATRHLHWRFFGGDREHWWDRRTAHIRIEDAASNTTILMNLDTRAGRAFRSGEEVSDPAELAAALEQAYAWWVNDSYWMVMPYKLSDPGVQVTALGPDPLPDGRPASRLELTFDSVGLTPQNRYVLHVAHDTGLVEQWTFYGSADDAEPRFALPWGGWKRFGSIWLATDHGRGADWEIAVLDELPAELYSEP